MSALDELIRLTAWSGRSYVRTDWDVVEHRLGVKLPAEYKDLHEVFPPGSFQAPRFFDGYVIVQPPYHIDGAPDQLCQFTTEMDELRDWRRTHPDDVPYHVHPEQDGLLPWARSTRELLTWRRGSPRPDDWTVVVSNDGIWRLDEHAPVTEEFGMSAVEFLVGLVSGTTTSRILTSPDGATEPRRSHADRETPAFTPVAEAEWREFAYTTSPTITHISLRRDDSH